MSITKIIEEIANTDKPLMSSRLADLSQMTMTDLPLLKRKWHTIAIVRRRQIISRLIELSKDNVELNFDFIFQHGLTDTDAEVRIGSIDGLWENENPSLIKTFITMLQKDSSHDVQASAATALGKFSILAECEEIRENYKTILQHALLETINDINKPVEVRRRALEAVAPISSPEIKKAINQAYESSDERFTSSALYAMGKTCDTTWLPILYKEMDNVNNEIRYEAAGACGEIGNQESIPYLLEHIYDADIEVRIAIIQALAKIGGTEAKKILLKISHDENTAIREAVKQARSEIDVLEDMTILQMDLPGEQNDRWN